jgi:hypothetical protein
MREEVAIEGVEGGDWRRYALKVLEYELDWVSGKENGRAG